jgi:hypothetical protein
MVCVLQMMKDICICQCRSAVAAQHGAKVISMSYGSNYSEQTEQQILQTAYNQGIICWLPPKAR